MLTCREAFVEHESTASVIATALCEIADTLPCTELASSLYPTDVMRSTTALLYSHIVRFLIRALQWYREGRFKHALHSITRPVALRYDDLIKNIRRDAQSINSQAVVNSQAEQREMHLEIKELRERTELAIIRSHNEQQTLFEKLDALTSMISQMRESIVLDQSVNASARIEFRVALSDIQLTQALDIISSQCNIDHKSNFESFVFLRNRRKLSTRTNMNFVYTSPKLKDWNESSVSLAILIQAPFRDRLGLQDFCTNVIEELLTARFAILWILRDHEKQYSLSEVLKSLILQALSLDRSSHTDLVFSFQLRRFLGSYKTEDYLDLLEGILQHFERVYIVADAAAMSKEVSDQCRVELCKLSHRLSDRNVKTVIKTIILAFGPSQGQLLQQPVEDIVIRTSREHSQSRYRSSNRQFGRAAAVGVSLPNTSRGSRYGCRYVPSIS